MGRLKIHSSSASLKDQGPTIKVSIGFDKLDLEEAQQIGLEIPKPLVVIGLIDTGASITVINPEIAKTCKLRQTGTVLISAVGNSGMYPEYAASIQFPGSTLKGLDVTRIVACSLIRQPVSCLIGRDFLRRWLFTYDGKSGTIVIED
jgi:predicted aspartyl protease